MTEPNDRTPRIKASTLRKLHADASWASVPKQKRRNAHPEDDIQQEIIAYADGCDCFCGRGDNHDLGRHVAAVPNGGRRNLFEAKRLKRCGVRAGVSDLIVIMPRGLAIAHCQIAFIEVKTPDGTQQPSQCEFQEFVESMGGDYHIVRSVDEFARAMEHTGLTWRESPIAKMRREKP